MRIRKIISLTALGFTLLLVSNIVPALADYIGPNRTTTTTVWRRRRCSYLATVPGYSCTLTLYYPPSQSCPSTSSAKGFFTWSACGWPSNCTAYGDTCVVTKTYDGIVGCSPGEEDCTQQTTTTNLPPATVSGSFSCSTPGDNGWCVGGGAINFTANEPVSGYNITYVERSSGVLCDPADAPSVSCSWGGGGEGNYSINFWAHSSYGDTSTQSSATWRMDTVPPSVSISVSGGTPGGGGWYRGGPITVSPSASDATSGVASAQVREGGGAWQSSLTLSGDGTHSIEAQAIDAAGHSATSSTTVRIDNSGPSVSISLSGQQGGNGWFIGPVTATVNASDGPSGLQTSQIQADGGGWANGSVTVSGDGGHNFTARAVDVAGNESTATGYAKIDGSPPGLTYTIEGTEGLAGWYVSEVTVHINASDSGSGLKTVRAQVGGGDWQNTRALDLSDGSHAVNLEAVDFAGHQSSASLTVQVDTQPPILTIADAGAGPTTDYQTSGIPVTGQATATPIPVINVTGSHSFTGQAEDTTSGVGQIEVSFDGGETWDQASLNGGDEWSHRWDAAGRPDGVYTVTARAIDVAGNMSEPVSLQFNLSTVVEAPEPEGSNPEEEAEEPSPQVEGQPDASPPGTTVAASHFPLLGFLGGAGTLLFLLGVGASIIVDPRPAAIRRLEDDFDSLQARRAHSQNDFSSVVRKSVESSAQKTEKTTRAD
jgi:hypothetical protein